MKRLVGLLLLISFYAFFLPFPAEGRDLKIADEFCTGKSEHIIFDILVENTPNSVRTFGFEVRYDGKVLEYQDNNKEKPGRDFYVRDEKYTSKVKIYGSGGHIDRGESGKLMDCCQWRS